VKKLIAVVVATGATAVLAIPALAGTAHVKVADDYFVRKGSTPTVTIRKGSTVQWIWSGRHPHNVYGMPGNPVHFHSPTHTRTGTYKHRFTRRGLYLFQCTYHANMKMKVRVK
jgi:plastocyanin